MPDHDHWEREVVVDADTQYGMRYILKVSRTPELDIDIVAMLNDDVQIRMNDVDPDFMRTAVGQEVYDRFVRDLGVDGILAPVANGARRVMMNQQVTYPLSDERRQDLRNDVDRVRGFLMAAVRKELPADLKRRLTEPIGIPCPLDGRPYHVVVGRSQGNLALGVWALDRGPKPIRVDTVDPAVLETEDGQRAHQAFVSDFTDATLFALLAGAVREQTKALPDATLSGSPAPQRTATPKSL
jgi:hypothetical protein